MKFFKKIGRNLYSGQRILNFFRFFILFGLSVSFNLVKAQDAVFSQYYSSALYLNPAFSAAETRLMLSSNYRTQWKSIVAPYQTFQTSLIVPIKVGKIDERHIGGFGVSVYGNRAGEGDYKTTGVNLNFGYNIRFTELHVVSLGLQGGLVQKSINLGNLTWGSMLNLDPNDDMVDVSNLRPSLSFPDFAGGLIYYFNPDRNYNQKPISIYAGAAVYHLTQPNESLVKDRVNKLPYLLKSHAGFEVNIAEKFNISPNVLIAMQNNQRQINAGCYFTFLFGDEDSKTVPSFLLLGGWYRVDDSVIFSAGFGSSVYTIGISYDLNNSSLRYNTQGRGAMEISLKLRKPGQKQVRTYNPLI